MLGFARNRNGFTIVELLIIVTIIAILGAVVASNYGNIQATAQDTRRQSDIKYVQKLIEIYHAEHDEYPKTSDNITVSSPTTVRSDANCTAGTQQQDWVPDITGKLPQSTPNYNQGVNGNTRGCYMYASDGVRYVLSAWNNISTGPQTNTMYRRVGFREVSYSGMNAYLCNHNNIGGYVTPPYNIKRDYYKYSYTISNITNCNETPPPGA